MADVKLGYRYKDPVSGFQGTATAITTHLWGCRRVTLEGQDEKGEPKGYVFDEPQLKQVGTKPTVEPATPEERKTGGPHGATEVHRADR